MWGQSALIGGRGEGEGEGGGEGGWMGRGCHWQELFWEEEEEEEEGTVAVLFSGPFGHSSGAPPWRLHSLAWQDYCR